ncbi:unnamed protein product [Urochloa humidicola]
MFGLRVKSFPAASAAPATVAADDGGGGADGMHPHSSHPPPPTSSSPLAPVELPGASSGAPARKRRVPYTINPNSIIQIYRSSSEYASAMLDALGKPAAQSASESLLPAWRGKVILVLAIPKLYLPDEFIQFCGVHVKHASNILIMMNDAVEDRYSALLIFRDQKAADDFYLNLNGWTFTERGEVCHALFVAALEFSTETASSIPTESTELPTCPVCIERLGDISGLAASRCDHSNPCSCPLLWANTSCAVCLFRMQQEFPSCAMCQQNSDLSMCMLCGFIGCGRYKKGHSKSHQEETGHSYGLDLDTWKICDEMHVLDCSRSNVEHADESDFRDLLMIRVEKAIDEPNCRFSRAFEAQGQYYKILLTEAKEGRELRISEAVMKAVNDKNEEVKLKLKNAIAEKDKAECMNKKLTQSTNIHLQLVAEIQKSEIKDLKVKDKKIHEIEEQITDYKNAIKFQKSVKKDERLKEATLVPLGAVNRSDHQGKGRGGGKRMKQ